METTRHKALVRRFYEAVNQGDTAALERLHHHGIIDHASHGDSHGREALMQQGYAAHMAFPDLRFTVEDLIAEGERVVARSRMAGTNTGPWLGQPPLAASSTSVGSASSASRAI
jgi:predicted ester cyclase